MTDKIIILESRIEELEIEKGELIEFIGHLYVNYHLPYGAMDMGTKERFEYFRKKYLIKKHGIEI